MKLDTQGYTIEREKYLFDPFDEKLDEKLSSRYEEFKDNFTTDKLMTCRYIVLMFDIGTSLRLDIRDFWERRRVAAQIAGFKLLKRNSYSFEENVEKMLLGEDAAVNNAITKYILLFGIPEYAALVVYQTMLVFEVQKSLKGVYTSNTIKNVDHLKKQIKDITDELYGGKEVLNARKALYSRIEKERKAEKPEDIIKRINDGDTLDEFNPYDEGYSVDKMKFIGDH